MNKQKQQNDSLKCLFCSAGQRFMNQPPEGLFTFSPVQLLCVAHWVPLLSLLAL